MATKVINTGRVPLQVGIIMADGTKTSMRVMSRGRPDLAPGAKVDPNWLALHGRDVRVVEEKSIEVAAKAVEIDNTNTASVTTTDAPKDSAETVAAKEDTQ